MTWIDDFNKWYIKFNADNVCKFCEAVIPVEDFCCEKARQIVTNREEKWAIEFLRNREYIVSKRENKND